MANALGADLGIRVFPHTGPRIRDRFQGWSRDFTYREFPVAHGVSDEEIDLVADWLARHLGPARG